MKKEDKEINERLMDIYKSYPKKVQRTVNKIIDLERSKAHMGNPIGIYGDIVKIIKNEEK
jgi:hypothetical protein